MHRQELSIKSDIFYIMIAYKNKFQKPYKLLNTIYKKAINESVKKDILWMSLFYYHKNEIDTGTAFAKNLEGFCSLKILYR